MNGILELLGTDEASVCRRNFFREASALLLRPFNWLNQSYPDYLGQSLLLKETSYVL